MHRYFAILLFLCFILPASAATFTVTNCASSITIEGSLLWAVDQANALNEPSIVQFNIPSSESGYTSYGAVNYWKIAPDATIQLKKDGIQIKGSTQTANQGDTNPYGPEVAIDGNNMSAPSSIFEVTGFNDCVIEGMAISGTSMNPIFISSGNRHKIYGCYIGTDVTGEVGAPSGSGIILLNSGNNLIGGSGLAARNIISRSGSSGIFISNSTFNQIINNMIGCDRAGNKSLSNESNGILIDSGSTNNYIAGGNVIAFNASSGVKADGGSTRFNTFTQNSYFANGLQGISLSNSANNSIVFPFVATSEYYGSVGILYAGGTAPANSTVEIMKVATPEDPSGRGQGKVSLGFGLADANGNWFTYLPTSEAQTGDRICATATDQSGNTSEFSQNFSVLSGTVIYRPDAMIGLLADRSDYSGENVFNSTGDLQSKDKTIFLGEAVIYYVKVINSGNISPDKIKITAPGNSTDWEINYFDAKTGGNDITSQVTGSGWITPNIGSGESEEMRIEVKSVGTTPSGKAVLLTAASASNPSRFDVVRATTTAIKSTLPDRYSFTVSSPSTAEAGKPFSVTITAKNPSGQVTTEVSGRTHLTVDAGTVSVQTIEASQFAASGIFQGTLILSNVGNRTVTITNDYISGTAVFQVLVSVPPDIVSGGLNRFGPNPFNPLAGKSAIWYWLNEDVDTTIYIFDMQGNLIFKKFSPAGQPGGKAEVNSVSWDGRNNFGEILDNGVYFLKIVNGNKSIYNGKIIILK